MLQIDDEIIDFLKTNKGKAYTIESLSRRVEKRIQPSDLLKYFRNNIQGILNRLAFSLQIDTHRYQGKDFYYIE